MGRAIKVDTRLDSVERELEQLKTAFSGLADTVDSLKDTATTRKHVDLHEDKPVTKPKKIKKAKAELVEEAEA